MATKVIGEPIFTFVCMVGALLGILWILSIKRSRHWMAYWNGRLEALENIEPRPKVRVFGGSLYNIARLGTPITGQLILIFLSSIFTVVWIALLTLSFWQWLMK